MRVHATGESSEVNAESFYILLNMKVIGEPIKINHPKYGVYAFLLFIYGLFRVTENLIICCITARVEGEDEDSLGGYGSPQPPHGE